MIVYLDTSALVKLYVDELNSDAVRQYVEQAELIATCPLTYVEARATIARKVREGEFTRRVQERLVTALDGDWEQYLIVDVSAALCRFAGDLAETHPLRGGDAIQLASALTTDSEAQGEVLFLCFDERLRTAAEAEGLFVR
jgi:predicted nucleic acid-binding protein